MREPESFDLPASLGTPRVLAVDDDPAILRIISRLIAREKLPCDTASSIQEARELLKGRDYGIMILDLSLPDGSGSELLDDTRIKNREAVPVFVTGEHDLQTALQLFRNGAYDFITKPFTLELFYERLAKALEEWHSRSRLSFYRARMEELIEAKTEELARQSSQIERNYDMTVSALGAVLNLHETETEGHCRRVSENSVRLGMKIGLQSIELQKLRWGAYLHDVGKIGIPERILRKTSPLDPSEMQVVKTHPVLGSRLIAGIDFLRGATDVVLYHHERFDGSGYPYGLRGAEIPLAARVFAVMDAMDGGDTLSMESIAGATARGFEYFRLALEVEKGRHFDPWIVDNFLEMPASQWLLGEISSKTESREEGKALSP